MRNFENNIRRFVLLMPIISIIGMSFYPLQTWVQQVLILFALLWFNIFILFDVVGK